jgi:hypothetical protein
VKVLAVTADRWIILLDGESRLQDFTPVVLEMLELLKELEEARGSLGSGDSGGDRARGCSGCCRTELTGRRLSADAHWSSRLLLELAGGEGLLLGVEARSGRGDGVGGYAVAGGRVVR